MALINPNITLDTKTKYTDTIFLTQGEYGSRQIGFTLLHGGVAIDLTGCTVNFLAKKPSGALLTNACVLTTPANGKFTYTVTEQTSIEAGTLTDARIEVIKTGVLLRSFKINVTIEAVPDYTTAIESTDEFTALQALSAQIAQIGTLSTLLTTAKTSLVAAINELFTSKINKAGGSENPFTAMPYVGVSPVIESGTGYVKYADGSMTCSGKKTFSSVPITTAWGGLFISAASAAVFDAFPVAFIAVPVVIPFIGHTGTTGSCFVMSDIANMSSTTSPGGICAVRGTTGTINVAAEYIAHGRWKA